MGRDEGIGSTSDRELELQNRVLSLLHINVGAENTIEDLKRKIRSLKSQCNGLKNQIKNNKAAFEHAMKTADDVEKLVDDLRAENRTMRMVVRGIGMTNIDRID